MTRSGGATTSCRKRAAPGPGGPPGGRPANEKCARRKLTVEQRAQQKIHDTYRNFTDEEIDVKIAGPDGLTLRGQLEADLRAQDNGDTKICWGPKYHAELKRRYKIESEEHKKLGAGLSDSSDDKNDKKEEGPGSGPAGPGAAKLKEPVDAGLMKETFVGMHSFFFFAITDIVRFCSSVIFLWILLLEWIQCRLSQLFYLLHLQSTRR